MKPNVIFHGQEGQDLPEETNKTSSPLSSPCSPHHQTRAKTRARVVVHEESPSKKVQKDDNQQGSPLSPEVESTESEDQREDPLRQIPIDATCFLPENFHFPIADSKEMIHYVDHGSLLVDCTAEWVDNSQNAYVTNLNFLKFVVEEVETLPVLDTQSGNNDADNGHITGDTQAKLKYEPEDEENDDSAGEDYCDDPKDLDFTLQPSRTTDKSQKYAARTYGKSNSTVSSDIKRETAASAASSSTIIPPLECPTCQKQFTGGHAERRLKGHINVQHSPVQNFNCPHCPASFWANKNRLNHIRRVHIKIKPLSCKFCDKKFAFFPEKNEHEMVCFLMLM
jgi:hypothetical protein